MNQHPLTVVAAALEVGIPVLLGCLMYRYPTSRRRLVVLLGATTPFLFALPFVDGHPVRLTSSYDDPGHLVFVAPWVVELPLWATSLVFGVGLLFLPRPKGLFGRYLLGCSAILCAYLLMFQILAPAYYTA